VVVIRRGFNQGGTCFSVLQEKDRGPLVFAPVLSFFRASNINVISLPGKCQCDDIVAVLKSLNFRMGFPIFNLGGGMISAICNRSGV
jgi:hypothetical protein